MADLTRSKDVTLAFEATTFWRNEKFLTIKLQVVSLGDEFGLLRQWRIQNLGVNLKGGRQPIILAIFSRKLEEIEKIGPRVEVHAPSAPWIHQCNAMGVR